MGKEDEIIVIKKKSKPIIKKSKPIIKRTKIIKKRISTKDREIENLKNVAFVYKSKEEKYKKFKWVVVFTRNPSGIRGKVPALYMKEKFKENSNNTVWGPIDKRVITDGKKIDVMNLPQTHIDFLLNEIKYVKEF